MVQAQDATWTGAGAEWSTGSNWSTGSVPSGTATFTNNGAPTSVTNNAYLSINEMQFSTVAPAYNFTIQLSNLYLTGAGIVNNSSFSPSFTNNGTIEFENASTAGNAKIINNFTLSFNNASTAGTSTISNNAPLYFQNTSTAANATITNSNFVEFLDTSTAGNATITNTKSGFIPGILFSGNSTAGNARLINNSGGTIDFSYSTGPLGNNVLSAGSVEGAGLFYLGANQLTVGGNNLSTTVSGIISDCGTGGQCIASVLGPPPLATGGSLVKLGTGTLTLTGANTYTGSTTVNGGTLEVDGSIASANVVVNAGGTLSGSGSIGDPTINAGGTLAPGTASSIGTLTINGPLTFASGSNYNVRLSRASNDFTQVNGTATINGGTVNVSVVGFVLPSTPYTILTATGGVTGTFSGVNGNLAFLKAALSYDANDVYVSLVPNYNFAMAAATKNELMVAGALAAAGPKYPNAPSIVAFDNLTAPQAQAAFDAISGEGIAAADTAGLQASQLFSSAMADQTTLWLDGGRSGGNEMVLSEPVPGALFYASAAGMKTPIIVHDPLMPSVRTWRAWASGFGGDENVHGNASLGSTEQSAEFYGGAMGIDYQINPTLLFGVAGSGSDGTFNVPGRSTNGSVTGGHIGTYGVATFGAFYAASSTSLSFFHNSETRLIAGFGGLSGEKEHGGYDSRAVRTRLEFGRRFGDVYGATVTPFVALEIADLRSNGFTETPQMGAGNFALNVQGRDTASVPAYMGLRFERLFDLSGGMTLKPVLSLAYGHDFAQQREITNALLGLASNPFEIEGAQVARDFAQTKAGFELAFAPNAVAFVNFDGKFSGKDQVYGGKGGIKLAW